MVQITGLNILELYRLPSRFFWDFYKNAKRITMTHQQRVLYSQVLMLSAQGFLRFPKPTPKAEDTLGIQDFYQQLEGIKAILGGELPEWLYK